MFLSVFLYVSLQAINMNPSKDRCKRILLAVENKENSARNEDIVCDLDILPTTRNCLNSPNNENFLNNDDGDFLPASDDDTTYAPPKKICCRSSSSTSSSSSSSSSSNLSSSSSGKSSGSSSTTSASHLSKCLQATTQHTNLEDPYDIMGVLINTIDDFSDAPISSLDSYLNNQISETNTAI